MEIERRFLFRASAAPVGGRISRPREFVIDTEGASELTVLGGRCRGRLGPTALGKYARLGSAKTFAEGLYDDRKLVRELTHGRARHEDLTARTTVRCEVRNIVVGDGPTLRMKRLRAALSAQNSSASEEASIRAAELLIQGIDIDGHTLIVDINHELFDKYDTTSKIRAAFAKPAFARTHGKLLRVPAAAPGRRGTSRTTDPSRVPMYGTVVRGMRWKKKPYPGATIDEHVVTVPDFGRIYFGEIFVGPHLRRLTMARLVLGSPVGGFVAFSEVEQNGAWYP
jgi:hypothetical protein